MIDRDKFWEKARPIFSGPSQDQVDGTNTLLDYWEAHYPNGDLRWCAYALATTKWETAHTMQPVREAYWMSEAWRSANLRYYPYYGRGYVQLTWQENYARESQPDRTGVDLVSEPDLALSPDIAAAVLFAGMQHGDFGGTGFRFWFNSTTDDPIGARHLVNGTDHATEIAQIHWQFSDALTYAHVVPAPPTADLEVRVAALEAQVFSLTARVSALEGLNESDPNT